MKKNIIIVLSFLVILLLIFLVVSKNNEISQLRIQQENQMVDHLNQRDLLEKDVKQLEDKLLGVQEKLDENLESIERLDESLVLSKKKLSEYEAINLELEDALRLATEPGFGATYILEQKGIKDYRVLIEDLKEHNEIIGYDGILGGTMYFSDVRILTKDWAFAFFDDGHYGGYGLYSFEITDNQDIRWKTILEVID